LFFIWQSLVLLAEGCCQKPAPHCLCHQWENLLRQQLPASEFQFFTPELGAGEAKLKLPHSPALVPPLQLCRELCHEAEPLQTPDVSRFSYLPLARGPGMAGPGQAPHL